MNRCLNSLIFMNSITRYILPLVTIIIFISCSTANTMKNIILTGNAPMPIGPYSQAVEANGFIFVSGQIAINPETGLMVEHADIKTEAKQVMENIEAIITASGSSMNNIVKCTIFLRDMNSFTEVNSVYGEYFPRNQPARETVEVSDLPKNANVEISVIAVK